MCCSGFRMRRPSIRATARRRRSGRNDGPIRFWCEHMKRPAIGVTAACLVALLTVTAARQAAPGRLNPAEFVAVQAPVVALIGVRVIDGTGGPPAGDQTLVISDGRILSLGPRATATIPQGAHVLDLKGHTVIPGIVGMHDHLYGYDGYGINHRQVATLYLASGVTTLRTAGAFEPYKDI